MPVIGYSTFHISVYHHHHYHHYCFKPTVYADKGLVSLSNNTRRVLILTEFHFGLVCAVSNSTGVNFVLLVFWDWWNKYQLRTGACVIDLSPSHKLLVLNRKFKINMTEFNFFKDMGLFLPSLSPEFLRTTFVFSMNNSRNWSESKIISVECRCSG